MSEENKKKKDEEIVEITDTGLVAGEDIESAVSTIEDTGDGIFNTMLTRTGAKIRADRAVTIAEGAELFYKRQVEDLRVELTNLIRERENYLDLSPDHALSLKLATDFKPKEFVDTDIKLSIKIRNLSIEYAIAKKRYNRLFGKVITD